MQKYYQLNFLTNNVFEDVTDGSIVDRKLNVAMTRAEEHLIMFGSAELLSNNFTFFKLLEFVRSKHGFFCIRTDDYVKGRFEVPQYEPADLDLGKATFFATKKFNDAFAGRVLKPVMDASGEDWPSLVFGHDMHNNLNAIGYGRTGGSGGFRQTGRQMTAERQVLTYCYYFMRQYYCSSRGIFTTCKEWTAAQMAAVNQRVQMIDVGCGPATCGIAFAEIFNDVAPGMTYTGIDVSAEMKRMGIGFMHDVFDGKIDCKMLGAFSELDSSYWKGCSELPSLIVFNLSYFFSSVTAEFSERLAAQIGDVMRRYPLNRYLFFVQQSECDKELNSYKVFKRVLTPQTVVAKSENASYTYYYNMKEGISAFSYEVWSSNV